MPVLRYATVRALYEASPSAAEDVGVPPTDDDPLTFLHRLAAGGKWSEAVVFSAYLLQRHDAVDWGCRTMRVLRPAMEAGEAQAVEAAEAWVADPEEATRWAALMAGMRGDSQQPGVWMALAAGWSGGSIVPPEYGNVRAEPHQTARAIRAGLLIALTKIPDEDHPALLAPSIEQAVRLANGEPEP